MLKKILFGLLLLFILLVLLILLGPKVNFEQVDPIPLACNLELEDLELGIRQKDESVSDLKENNEGKLFWNNDSIALTEYAVVYLHGFSASGMEGLEIAQPFAQAIKANLYIPRLIEAGRKSEDTFKGVTPDQLISSAKEAIAIGKCLGDKLILMSCSTGGTYSAYLAGHDPEIDALIMMSPNIALYDERSSLLLKPWGRKLLNYLESGEYHHVEGYNDEKKKYWNAVYHTDGILALVALINQTMQPEVFQKISQPIFLMNYFKNEEEKDEVVSVPAMREFISQVSTPKEKIKYIECARCQNHVISSSLFNDSTHIVLDSVLAFAKNVLEIEMSKDLVLSN